MRTCWLAAALLWASVTVHASITAHADTPKDRQAEISAAQESIDQGVAYIRDDNPEAAGTAFNTALNSPAFGELPLKAQHEALLLSGSLAYDNKDYTTALARLRRATAIQSPDIEEPLDRQAWNTRLNAAYLSDDYRDSAQCITHIAQSWPTDAVNMTTTSIYTIDAKIMGTDPELERGYLQALFDVKWGDKYAGANALWRDLSLLWLRQGNRQQAMLVARRITSARVAISMLVDKRFDPITQTKIFDVNQIIANELANARASVAASPDKLEPIITLQLVLLDTHHYAEAISIADGVIAKVGDGTGASHYTDFDDNYVWVLDSRAQALESLGHWDEAVAQWLHAARRPEKGGMNVSQVLNLAMLYASIQRPKDALDMVSDLGEMSPYGRMILEEVKVKVAVDQNDPAAITTHLDYMRAHRSDAISSLQAALIVTGKTDEATDLLVERLSNEKWRSDALAEVQDYLGTVDTPLGTIESERWKKIVADPKVRAAVAKVGRIEHFDLDPP
jgi:tetratricopeptide (TPR) repeat protein